jgi:site-specific recombinase XerD
MLSPQARVLLKAYISGAGLHGDARLFPITPSRYRQLIKAWVRAIGLDPARYSGHTSRRSMPALVYAQTKDLAACRHLLAHKDITHTAAYLSVDLDAALSTAKDVMGFTE